MEQEEFITIKENCKAEITVKKSKFIAEAYYVQSVKEAENIIKQIQKREHSARHHCYAYRILEDNLIQKMSDDGEPSGTAGAPMLAILQGRNLINVLIVVTRYFGGILLGTGGLVRAYSDSAISAIDNAQTKKMQNVAIISFETDYSEIEKIKYYLNQINGKTVSFEYKDNVNATIIIPKNHIELFKNHYQKIPFKIQNLKFLQEKIVDI